MIRSQHIAPGTKVGVCHPGSVEHLGCEDFRAALAMLPRDQREALLLVGVQGLSYEEAAQVCNAVVCTVKAGRPSGLHQ